MVEYMVEGLGEPKKGLMSVRRMLGNALPMLSTNVLAL